ncbi:hypothetical protein YC2023_081444 [Brassica napus]
MDPQKLNEVYPNKPPQTLAPLETKPPMQAHTCRLRTPTRPSEEKHEEGPEQTPPAKPQHRANRERKPKWSTMNGETHREGGKECWSRAGRLLPLPLSAAAETPFKTQLSSSNGGLTHRPSSSSSAKVYSP